jgi:hypothetical protein
LKQPNSSAEIEEKIGSGANSNLATRRREEERKTGIKQTGSVDGGRGGKSKTIAQQE